MNVSVNSSPSSLNAALKSHDLGEIGLRRDMADVTNCRCGISVGYHGLVGKRKTTRFGEFGISEQVTPGLARGTSAEARHPASDIEEESLACLLAIVRDIDPDVMLAGNCGPRRARNLLGQGGGVDRVALLPARIEFDEIRWSRQASRMRRQDPTVASDCTGMIYLRH